MADVLRDMADMLDQTVDKEPEQARAPGLTPVEVTHSDETDSSVMIPPLQQKIELLKKAVDVDNHFDNDSNDEDELSRIKHLGGIPKAAVIQISGEDNDILG